MVLGLLLTLFCGGLFLHEGQRLRIGDGGAFEKRQPSICTNAQ